MSLFFVDAEATDLYGQVFIIAVVVTDLKCNVLEERTFRYPAAVSTGSWVAQNVLPVNANIPMTHDDEKSMLEAFYDFWMTHKVKGAIPVSHCAHPVETGLWRKAILLQVQQGNQEAVFHGPFPVMIDIAQMLHEQGHNPASVVEFLIKNGADATVFKDHNALDDVRAEIQAYRMLKNL